MILRNNNGEDKIMILKIRRLLAIYIDFIIIFSISYFPLYYISSLFDNKILNMLLGIITIISFIFLFLNKDILIGYESIGKKIMLLKIYQNKERISNKKILKDRVFYSAYFFCFYPFMILYNNKSRGDLIFETEVK